LVATGLVEQRQEVDGQIYYRLNRDKEAEARAWVEGGDKAVNCCSMRGAVQR
jgi:hypothetical protein